MRGAHFATKQSSFLSISDSYNNLAQLYESEDNEYKVQEATMMNRILLVLTVFMNLLFSVLSLYMSHEVGVWNNDNIFFIFFIMIATLFILSMLRLFIKKPLTIYTSAACLLNVITLLLSAVLIMNTTIFGGRGWDGFGYFILGQLTFFIGTPITAALFIADSMQ